MFDTFGPYTLHSHDKSGIDKLWTEFRADPYSPNIEDGVGVYLVCVKKPDGNLLPCYVGQTYKSFGERLKRHFDNWRFADLLDRVPLIIILIARAKDGQIEPRKTDYRARLDRKLIDWLEVDLIGKFFAENRNLLNRQHVQFLKSIWVGGYRGDRALDPEQLEKYPAYLSLAKMLNLAPATPPLK